MGGGGEEENATDLTGESLLPGVSAEHCRVSKAKRL